VSVVTGADLGILPQLERLIEFVLVGS
jgi:hypothetical protein